MSAIIIGSGSSIDKEIFYSEKINIEYVICADGGLEKAEYLGLLPDVIIGDLDSVNTSVLKRYIEMNIEIIEYPSEKNYTDMDLAIQYAVEKGYKEIILIGASGSRIDHTMANILLVELYYKKGIKIKIVDNNNIVQMVTGKMEIEYKKNYFVSIIPTSDTIEGITLEGFKYPLNNVNVKRGSTLCISNQITEEKGIITLAKGNALVILSKD